MKRTYAYDEWVKRPRENARLIALLAQRQRLPRRRPRDPVEARLLREAALESMRRRGARVRLVRVGPRRYELREAPRPREGTEPAGREEPPAAGA